MAKTEIYSWRLDPEIKMGLEQQARRHGISLARFLDRTARQVIEDGRRDSRDGAEQARLHVIAAKYAGVFAGSDRFASEQVSEVVRNYITKRNAR